MINTKTLSTLALLILWLPSAHSSPNPFDMIYESPFLQGGCLIPEPLSLVGVEIQAKINVKANGRISYTLMEPKNNADAKKILNEIIKCPITIGTEKKFTLDHSEPAYYRDDFFYFAFKPISLDTRKGLERCFKPRYHTKALAIYEQGVTVLQYKINSTTNTPTIQIVKSSNSPRLDETSVEHIRNCLSYDIVKSEIQKEEWHPRTYNWKIK